jgi:SAM-dependent methyltransferase
MRPKKVKGDTKAQWLAKEVAKAVGAGREVEIETVDFSDPNRPKSCLEVDFPILPVNQIAAIEGNAGKPIYQMSKWWARRRSSVFRSMLIAASMKAPDDPSQAAKAVWDLYYANLQKKRSLAHLNVADIFMGGGTTVVEGSRLGLQMFGNDLNPVAWFVVKTELAQVKKEEVAALLKDIEAEVKPQIMPFYACRGPHGEKGVWTRLADSKVMGDDFDPLTLKPHERKDYKYEGPEIIYVFWAKHGPCGGTECSHRTPVMSLPVLAVKELTVRASPYCCKACGSEFDVEECEARMAPDVPLVLAPGEKRFVVRDRDGGATCPLCHVKESLPRLAKPAKKKVSLTLLVHPQWLEGEASKDEAGRPYGGSVTDDAESSGRWHTARARNAKLIEVRGVLPEEVTCPDTQVVFKTAVGTVPKDAHFACGECGTKQRIVVSTEASGKSGPIAATAVQAFSAKLKATGAAYGGRYFVAASDARSTTAAHEEWEQRRNADLAPYWPRSEIPFGHMTHQRQPLPQHGYLRWSDMFGPRQLLVNSLLLKAINEVGGSKHRWEAREFALAAFQQYLRNQNMFTIWNPQRDTLEPMFANNNFHPKSTVIENCVFPNLGRGNWMSCSESLAETLEWAAEPWELVNNDALAAAFPELAADISGRSEKTSPLDPVQPSTIACGSATELLMLARESQDLVATDPPFGGLLHYSELSDFFYVWLRLVLRDRYPDQFGPEYTPKSLEAVANIARNPADADAYYQRLLTASWKEAHRILKPGGTLAFTFHHSEDAPWVSVLESLFDAGFYLEATYPIRSDETKGEGEFGSKKIEYDIIHVCRKRTEDPTPVSWAKMRRQVLDDVRGLRQMLEVHQKAGLPEQDLRIIRIGKALEYYSRHYGKVLVDDEKTMSVADALAGIQMLLDEEAGGVKDPPPVMAEPFTRQFLRLFDGATEMARDQIQKSLRGSGIAPADFEARGWCREVKKVFLLTPPLEIARSWKTKNRRHMTSDYDQAAYLIGACFEGSGINAADALAPDSFKPHAALGALLDWFKVRGATPDIRTAASRARTILSSWRDRDPKKETQLRLFFEAEEPA